MTSSTLFRPRARPTAHCSRAVSTSNCCSCFVAVRAASTWPQHLDYPCQPSASASASACASSRWSCSALALRILTQPHPLTLLSPLDLLLLLLQQQQLLLQQCCRCCCLALHNGGKSPDTAPRPPSSTSHLSLPSLSLLRFITTLRVLRCSSNRCCAARSAAGMLGAPNNSSSRSQRAHRADGPALQARCCRRGCGAALALLGVRRTRRRRRPEAGSG